MIKRIDKNITIGKPINLVFSYVSNLENLPQITSFSNVQLLSGDGGVGSIYSASSKSLFSTRSTKLEIVKKDPPSLFAYKDTSQVYDNEIGFELKDEGGGSLVTGYIQVDISPLGNLLSGGINKNSEIELEKTLQKLKGAVEEDQASSSPQGPELTQQPAPEIGITSKDPEIETSFGKSPEEIAINFKKSNY